jgi:hypothetical protein
MLMGGMQPESAAISEPTPDLSEEDLQVLSEEIAPTAAERAGVPEEVEEDPIVEDGASGNDELQALKLQLAQTQGALSAVTREQNAGAEGQPQDPVERFTTSFFAKYDDVSPETQEFFKEFGKGLQGVLAAQVGGRIQGIEANLRESSGKQVLQEFETNLDSVMERSGLSEPEREIFKESVMMDGLRRYGNSFSTQQAIALYRQKHKKYIEARTEREGRDIVEMETEEETAPPATRRGANTSARDDVTGKLMQSRAPENSFGGKNWRRYIQSRIKSVAEGGA